MANLPNCIPCDTASWQIEGTKYTISGHSRSGERTGFCLNTQGIFFDAGMYSSTTPKFVFLTHSHTDHAFALPMMTISLRTPAIVYAPNEAVQFLQLHDQITNQMNLCSTKIPRPTCRFVGVSPKEVFEVPMKGLHWEVQVVECPHRVPSVGYCVSEVKRKLKDEYLSLPGSEIAKLKAENIDLFRIQKKKQFIFMGDTTFKVFELHPEVFEYPVIFIECTFLSEGEERTALKRTHVHWNHLKPFVKQNPQCLFMLIHFTLALSEFDIEQFFDKETKQENIKNLGLWLDIGIKVYNK